MSSSTSTPPPRLSSLDFMRGLIMVLLALESTELYEHLVDAVGSSGLQPVIRQFFHHPWHGLRFWDLVQPAFMFMAGVAMAFSLHRQQESGMTWWQSFGKTLRRCGWLFFWGVLDYAVRRNGLSFELWDVLTQLSFTTLVAFLIFRWPSWAQIVTCVGILMLAEILYRAIQIPGFDQPFVDQHNFGNYMDLVLMNKINPDGWVAINCISTAVHTIAGVLVGKLLLDGHATTSLRSVGHAKIKKILLWGGVCFALGYGLDTVGVTPIIKRIATSSFTLASLGWCLWFLAACYAWIDLLGHRRNLKFFTVVGMNSLFLYLLFEIVGHRWFNGYVGSITNGVMQNFHTPALLSAVITSLCIFTLEWELCYFLYRRNIFFKL